MRYLLLLCIIVASAQCWSTRLQAAEEKLPPAIADDASGVGGGFWEELGQKLVPSHTCPHCGQTFSEKSSLIMLIIGFVGQALFTSRFLVQWIASEQRKKSYIPVAFWYLSICGSLMLLAYAISILAWPIILGQCFGVIVYGRNLALITHAKNRALQNPNPDESEEESDPEMEESKWL